MAPTNIEAIHPTGLDRVMCSNVAHTNAAAVAYAKL
jgi:hypothetical protein